MVCHRPTVATFGTQVALKNGGGSTQADAAAKGLVAHRAACATGACTPRRRLWLCLLRGPLGQRESRLSQLPFQHGDCRRRFTLLAIVLRHRRLGVVLAARRILDVAAIE